MVELANYKTLDLGNKLRTVWCSFCIVASEISGIPSPVGVGKEVFSISTFFLNSNIFTKQRIYKSVFISTQSRAHKLVVIILAMYNFSVILF